MNLTVLGCSGGVGTGLRTTTLLVNGDVLIDAGTGVGDLPLEAMARVRHLFLTHSHLDHVTALPFIVDSIFGRIREPITVHGQAATLQALQRHIFNDVIWPDFSRLPHPDRPVMRYRAMAPGENFLVGDTSFEMIEVRHVVPGVGYRVESPTGAFAFSGDTSTNDTFWAALNRHERLDMLIVESAFANADQELARVSGHYTPRLLAEDLRKLKHPAPVFISHNKPGEEEAIFAECRTAITSHDVRRLSAGARFTL